MQMLTEVTIESILEHHPHYSLENDLVIYKRLSEIPQPMGPRRLHCLMIGLCTQGKVRYSIDTEAYEVAENCLFYMGEGQVINDYYRSEDCEGMAVFISYPFFREIFKVVKEIPTLILFGRNRPVSPLQAHEAQIIVSYMNAICRRLDLPIHYFRKNVVGSLLSAMLYDINSFVYPVQQSDLMKKSRADAIFTDFIRLLGAHYKHERRVSWYAAELGITPKYLSETIKSVSSRAPTDWIDDYVTREIKVMLQNTSLSIKEISEEMNFANQSFLGKYFKARVGVSPLKYRNG